MKKQYLFAAVLSVLGLISSNAMASGGGTSFSLVGAGNYMINSLSGTGSGQPATIKGAIGYGGGALVNFGMGNNSLEIGGLYMVNKLKFTIGNTSTTNDSKSIHIPVLYRFGGPVWTFGLGGFYDLTLESGGTSVYGLEAGPRVSFGHGWFLDGRFQYDLKEQTATFDTPQTFHMMTAMLLIGYRFNH